MILETRGRQRRMVLSVIAFITGVAVAISVVSAALGHSFYDPYAAVEATASRSRNRV
jgi:hypothetical protein